MAASKSKLGFLIFFLGFTSCAVQQSGVEFYEGLKKRQAGAEAEAAVCFEKALNADNSFIAAAAAAELMSMRAAGDEVSAAEAEQAAADGRIAASRSRYHEALLFFRIVLNDTPELFFRDPDLLADLGRTFQYAGAGKEGMDLFLKWEKIFTDEGRDAAALREAIPAGSEQLIRFRLLFFAARIARQYALSLEGGGSIELFEKALPFARAISPEQIDACIWYILDSSLAEGSEKTIRYLETYCSQWNDDAYFFDVLDKLARELVLKRQWENVFKVCNILQNRTGAAAAQYAWISGRLIQEDIFSHGKIAETYMRIAYDASGSGSFSGAVGYYRSLSAAALGEDFLTLPEPPAKQSKSTDQTKATAKGKAVKTSIRRAPGKLSSGTGDSEAVQFILGFFENDAAVFASRYIRSMESDLSVEELHHIAGVLSAAGQYQDSIRLVSLYANRNDYQLTRSDLELLYPRPFKELVERYAGETGIEAALLYGLIRTESAFDPNAVSRAGAAGLTQLMPATAEETADRIRRRGGPNYTGAVELSDPAVNIHIGAAYLAYLNERMDDPLLALLAYNGGMNRIRRWRTAVNRSAGNLPPDLFLEAVEYAETRNYGRSVMGAAAMYRELYY